MRYSNRFLPILSILFSVSCHPSGIIDGARVKLVRPGKTISLQADSTFNYEMPEVLNCLYLEIVNDTILVVQDRVSEENPYHFKAYSTKTFEYLGAFIRNGRGPGEMLSPHMVKRNSVEKMLTISQNTSSVALAIDVGKTVESGKTTIAENYELPKMTMDWLPLTEEEHFILQSNNNNLAFYTFERGEKVLSTFKFADNVAGESSAIFISSFLVGNGEKGQVADAMIFFPQINFFDTKNGISQSIAVNKDYKRWKSVSGQMINMDVIQYYVGIASSVDYIFAAYKCVPLGQLTDDKSGTSIHVFDWSGKFLYDIKVEENIKGVTFDSITQCLYCIERTDGRIVRYDFSDLI